nr:MAG TPA: hypothetical protein [Caudoviricetes sp.]
MIISTSFVSEFLLHETIENTLNTAINKVNILFIFNGFFNSMQGNKKLGINAYVSLLFYLIFI